MDIKSKYFKVRSSNAKICYLALHILQLSKQFHPDMTDDPAAKAKFHQVSEAYAVLGNDRQRYCMRFQERWH